VNSTVTGYQKRKCSSNLVAQSTKISKYNYRGDRRNRNYTS